MKWRRTKQPPVKTQRGDPNWRRSGYYELPDGPNPVEPFIDGEEDLQALLLSEELPVEERAAHWVGQFVINDGLFRTAVNRRSRTLANYDERARGWDSEITDVGSSRVPPYYFHPLDKQLYVAVDRVLRQRVGFVSDPSD